MVDRPQTASELLSEVRNLRAEIIQGQPQPPPPATAPAARGGGGGGGGGASLLGGKGGKTRSSAAARVARVRAKKGAAELEERWMMLFR